MHKVSQANLYSSPSVTVLEGTSLVGNLVMRVESFFFFDILCTYISNALSVCCVLF